MPVIFHLGACLYPGGIFDRSAQPSRMSPSPVYGANLPGPADRALQRLGQRRRELGLRTRVILAGDQIYVDATAGLLDPSTGDAPLERSYDRLHAQRWRDHALTLADEVLLMDDHEVVDNWEPSLHARRNAGLLETLRIGREAFIGRQRKPRGEWNPQDIRLWFGATLGGRLLFVGDTRSERSARDPARLDEARIMSATQTEALLGALRERQHAAPAEHKFIATSSMLLPRRLSSAEDPASPAAALHSDAWDGYPGSLHDLLAAIADDGLQRCVFLSGDEHIGCVAEATVQQIDAEGAPAGAAVRLWSVHAGALYAPFPFANSVTADFAASDRFEFACCERRYRCRVQSWFPAIGDGFAEIVVADSAPVEAGPGFAVVYRDALDPARDAQWPPGPDAGPQTMPTLGV